MSHSSWLDSSTLILWKVRCVAYPRLCVDDQSHWTPCQSQCQILPKHIPARVNIFCFHLCQLVLQYCPCSFPNLSGWISSVLFSVWVWSLLAFLQMWQNQKVPFCFLLCRFWHHPTNLPNKKKWMTFQKTHQPKHRVKQNAKQESVLEPWVCSNCADPFEEDWWRENVDS